MRSVLTGFKFSLARIALGPPDCGWVTVRYIAYLPLLCESPLGSFRSAIRMYATCEVFPSQGIAVVDPSVDGGGQLQRLSPPDASAASIAAITRSVMAPVAARKAFTAFGTTSPGRRIFPWIE